MERIYTYSVENLQDIEDAKKDATSVAQKLPALVELIKFLCDGTLEKYVEISEKIIDDAFDCMIDRDKVFIKTSNLPKQEKDAKVHQVECGLKLMKDVFKSSLKLKG